MTRRAEAVPASAAFRLIEQPRNRSRRVHFIGICGKGMGAIAAALAAEGWRVTGSDEGVYPPMNRFLAERGIPVAPAYDGANIPSDAELVVVGKRIREGNPELSAAVARGLPYVSFPALLRDAVLIRSRNAVVSGGVGKTTTTAMLAFILDRAGKQPDYLVGGLVRDLSAPARLSGSGLAVIEGDEYASCFDDPGPKFLKYAPEVLIVTNVLEDHPDLYPDLDSVERVFRDLVGLLPKAGCLIIPDDDQAALRLVAASRSPALRVGFSSRANRRITELRPLPEGLRFNLMATDFTLPLLGRMNIRNAAMAAVAASHFGVPLEQSASILEKFRGVVQRQDIQEAGTCIVVADKATHPIALTALLDGVRQKYPGRRLVSVVRPRATGGSGWLYQRELPLALGAADVVLLLDPYEHNPEPGRTWQGGSFSIGRLAEALMEGPTKVVRVAEPRELEAALSTHLRPRDVVVLSLPEQAGELMDATTRAASQV